MYVATMRDLVDNVEDEWGDPDENIGRIVPFGYKLIDEAMVGLPIDRGMIIVLQGVSGARKTSMAINFLVNQCLSGRLPQGYHIAYDTLESGMTVERIRDIMLSMVATKFLVYWYWNDTDERDIVQLLSRGLPDGKPIANLVNNVQSNGKRDTVLRPEAFRFYLSEKQHVAKMMAKNVIRNWPVFIFGASEHKETDIRKLRTTPTWNLEQSAKRWSLLYDEYNVRQLYIDHGNAYVFADNPNDYEIQKRVMSSIQGWQKESLGIAWLLAQVGVGAARAARSEGIDPNAAGGNIWERESSVTWTVIYDPDDPYFTKLKRPNKSRIGMHPDLAIMIEPFSGVTIGQATLWSQRII